MILSFAAALRNCARGEKLSLLQHTQPSFGWVRSARLLNRLYTILISQRERTMIELSRCEEVASREKGSVPQRSSSAVMLETQNRVHAFLHGQATVFEMVHLEKQIASG